MPLGKLVNALYPRLCQVFNLGNHRTETLERFISILEREVGRDAVKVMTEIAPGDVPMTYADIDHARDMLGYEPATTIEVGLRKFVAWYRSKDFFDEYAETGNWISDTTSREERALGKVR